MDTSNLIISHLCSYFLSEQIAFYQVLDGDIARIYLGIQTILEHPLRVPCPSLPLSTSLSRHILVLRDDQSPRFGRALHVAWRCSVGNMQPIVDRRIQQVLDGLARERPCCRHFCLPNQADCPARPPDRWREPAGPACG